MDERTADSRCGSAVPQSTFPGLSTLFPLPPVPAEHDLGDRGAGEHAAGPPADHHTHAGPARGLQRAGR